MRGFAALSGLGAVLVLIVVAASATIRLLPPEAGALVGVARGVHRVAASLAALVVVGVAFLAAPGRRATAIGALALTLALSIVGWQTGTNPPRAAALFNQIGGIALAALLAWLAGRGASIRAPGEGALAGAALGLAAAQALGGALLVTIWRDAPLGLYILHAACGLAAAACLAAAGIANRSVTLLAFAVAAPGLGLAAVLLSPSVAAQAAHALAAASLLAAAAHHQARTTETA